MMFWKSEKELSKMKTIINISFVTAEKTTFIGQSFSIPSLISVLKALQGVSKIHWCFRVLSFVFGCLIKLKDVSKSCNKLWIWFTTVHLQSLLVLTPVISLEWSWYWFNSCVDVTLQRHTSLLLFPLTSVQNIIRIIIRNDDLIQSGIKIQVSLQVSQ